jgi:hypothetical protein
MLVGYMRVSADSDRQLLDLQDGRTRVVLGRVERSSARM